MFAWITPWIHKKGEGIKNKKILPWRTEDTFHTVDLFDSSQCVDYNFPSFFTFWNSRFISWECTVCMATKN